MTSAKLSVNGTEYTLPEVDGVTLQFALRDDLGLTGDEIRVWDVPVRGMHGPGGRHAHDVLRHPGCLGAGQTDNDD